MKWKKKDFTGQAEALRTLRKDIIFFILLATDTHGLTRTLSMPFGC
jgi:hypothetical protein